MLRTALKSLLAHRTRLFATALAVTLGVSFMAGTLVLTDTVSRTFNGLFDNVYSGTSAVVRAKAAFNGGANAGEQRGRVDASLVDALRGVNGVAEVEGTILGFARLVAKDGQAIGNPAAGAPTFGGNWTDSKRLNSFTLVAGRPPATADEMVIDKKSARDGHLVVGDTTTVLVQGPPQRMLITGIVRFGSSDSPGGASVALFTRSTAQTLVAEPGKYDSISLVAKAGVTQQQLVQNLRAALPGGIEAVTGKQVTKEAQTQIGTMVGTFTTFMLVFAVVALLVGSFMIFNAFSITVAQRTRENGLLRALGATRRQVLSSVLLEALAVGLVSSLVGLALGVAVAAGLKWLLGAVGIDLPAGGIVFAARTVVIALVAGIGVTVVAAVSPARKASKVAPIAAMHGTVATGSGYGSKKRVLVGCAVLVCGVAALLFGLLGHLKSPVLIIGLGATVVFFAVAILGRTVSLPLSRILAAPLPRLRGAPGILARRNAMRNPKRTAATASALMICVGLVGSITIFASSARATINSVVDSSFTGDFIINSGAGLAGGVDPGLARRLNQLPQVASASGLRLGSAQVDGSVVQLGGVDPRLAFDIIDVKPLQGSRSDLGRDAIAVYSNVAADKHLKIGDRIPVVFKDTGPQSLRVALIYGSNQLAGNYFLGMSAYQANFTNQYDSYVFVKKAPGASAAAAVAAVKRVAVDYPGATVLDQTQFKTQTAQPINQLLGLVYALLALAVIIALLGIGNTLALSIFERTQELGLLRAVGMTRSQLRSTIRWESVIIALQGTVLGLLIGMFFGWTLVTALNRHATSVFSIPYTTLAVVVVLAAVAGVAAAILPARRAAKLNVLRAVVMA
ncbi:MAG: putative transport system permease protein [Acidimicrobiaceae bacterium]|jgi:putative ABC transport system permease protein|nr:putative transport system permease protein [Acidimicrobiaceae bacterium]MDQ1440151.1 putative transport system permease protein [Acidimicrobiaceae bacterium]